MFSSLGCLFSWGSSRWWKSSTHSFNLKLNEWNKSIGRSEIVLSITLNQQRNSRVCTIPCNSPLYGCLFVITTEALGFISTKRDHQPPGVPSIMPNNLNEQLTEFASLFLSTDPNTWQSPTSQTTASALLPTLLPDDHVLCSVTSFSLDKRKHHAGRRTKEKLALDVATSFNDELKFVASNIQSLGPTLTRNILQAFMALVDSRVRSTVQAFYKHAQHDSSQRLMQILQLLSTMSDSLVSPTNVYSRTRVVADSMNMLGAETFAPIRMETTIEVDILGEQASIVLEASGTIRALFDQPPSRRIVHAKTAFDTTSFLKIQMANARDIVKFATKRIFEVFLSPGNTQDTQAMDYQGLNTSSQTRSGTPGDEKECDSLPSVGDLRTPTQAPHRNFQNSYLRGKSLSGVDLLQMAAETLS